MCVCVRVRERNASANIDAYPFPCLLVEEHRTNPNTNRC